jgi:hypothetical protein
MAFEIKNLDVLNDKFDTQVYEWCEESIKSHFGLEPGKNEYGYEKDICEVLTEEQVNEIAQYQESLRDSGWIEGLAYSALNIIIDNWDNEQPVE